jgi:hypothetical protein
MSLSNGIRQTHRWVALAFTAGVLVNLAVLGRAEYPVWAGVMALAPLIVLQLTGLYLFFQPYAARRRGARPSA